MKTFQDPLDEFSRIARNKPHPGIDKNLPKVTDGTTSSIVQKTPRRIIQQLPTGRVVSDTNDWLTIVASFIYTNRILLNANMQFSLFEKCIQMVKGGLQNGSKTSYTPFVMRGNYIGTDLKVIGDKDIFFEPGKLSDTDSNFMFLRSWWQPKDIEAELHKQKQLKKMADERGEKFRSDWDLKALEALKDEVTQKPDDALTEAEKKQNSGDKGGIELVTAFQRGGGGKFFTLSPKTRDVVKTKVNKDPRGEHPLDTMYMDTDGYNPLGYGIVEQLAALQNLMDTEMQMYQFERALMLAPPTIKRGNWNKAQAKLVPNAIVDLGSSPDNSWEVLRRDTSALNNFAANYGLMKSQLLELASSPSATISAESGNPNFSKTSAGVDMQQANVSVDDNHIRKKFESWFERWSETAINLYFAERSGVEELQLDDETAMKLRKLDPALVSEDNKVTIDYDTATEALKFEVDASTSNMKNDAQQLEALDGLVARLEKSPILQQVIPPKKIIGAWNAIVAASGVENPEELSVSDEELDEQEQQQQAQMAAEPQMQQPMPEAPVEPPIQPELPPEMPPEQPPEEALSQDDLAFITALQDMGYSDEKIQQALAMEQFGMPNEEIIAVLEATV